MKAARETAGAGPLPARSRFGTWVAPVLVCGWSLFAVACDPSPYIYHEHVLYNFSDEGFLAPGMLQTIGVAPLERQKEDAPGVARSACVKRAARMARRRALRVVLHTRFDLPGGQGPGGQTAQGLEQDYAFPLTERDYIRGEIAFAELLGRGYIALQDLRSARECSIVFRIKGDDLPGEIRSVAVSFRPEGRVRRSRITPVP